MSGQQQINKLLGVFAEIKTKAGFDNASAGAGAGTNTSACGRRLELQKLERIVARLVEFSVPGDCCEDKDSGGDQGGQDCSECQGCLACQEYVAKLALLIQRLTDKYDQLEKADYKELRSLVQEITAHLQKAHQLIPEGYYIGTYMVLGISIGFIFGIIIFDHNPAFGIPIGMILGVAIGASLDGDAKKKGRVI